MYIDKIPQTEHKLGVSVSLPTLSRTAKRGPSPYCPPSFKIPPPKKKKENTTGIPPGIPADPIPDEGHRLSRS